MEGFKIDLKTFLGLTNASKLSESKYQAGFEVIISGQNLLTFMIPICDWIYGNRSKSHIGSYEIKFSKFYNQPRIVSMRMKLTQKVDYFTVFKSFPSTSCCSQKFPPNNLEKLVVGLAR